MIRNECVSKITSAAQKVIDHFDIDEGFYFRVDKAYLPHSGLGSGTQMGLSTGKLIAEHIGAYSNGYSL